MDGCVRYGSACAVEDVDQAALLDLDPDGAVGVRMDRLPVRALPDLPRQKWKRRSCGEGAHGPRVYDWARVEVRPWHRPDRKHWVPGRRSITDPTKVAYYIAYTPADATLNELIAVAGARWAIEECFQTTKGQCGLDDYQVRRHQGWYRHITLAMAAHACLTVLRAQHLEKGPDLLERQT